MGVVDGNRHGQAVIVEHCKEGSFQRVNSIESACMNSVYPFSLPHLHFLLVPFRPRHLNSKTEALIQDFEACRILHELLFRFGFAVIHSEWGRWS